jgi:hypothetical protein
MEMRFSAGCAEIAVIALVKQVTAVEAAINVLRELIG